MSGSLRLRFEEIDGQRRAGFDGTDSLFRSAFPWEVFKFRHGGDTVIDTDEQPGKARPDKIPPLKPAFAKDGTITAADASSISDGRREELS